jgi:hypothetical protein
MRGSEDPQHELFSVIRLDGVYSGPSAASPYPVDRQT